MPDKGFRVTVEDLDKGGAVTRDVMPGDYVILSFDPCYLASSVHNATGTVRLVLKGHQPQKPDTTDAQ